MIRMPGKSHAGPLEPLDTREAALRDQLRDDVEALAGRIGERSVRQPRGLSAAADRIDATFAAKGLSPRRQTFTVDGVACDNVEAEIAGGDRRGDIVVVGAHYDSVEGTTGANDNASGVAAMLALARAFAPEHPRATLRFVAFANEEPPHFQTANMGSLVYAKRCKERGERIVAMLSLETIGFYSDAADSQKYPPPLSLFYPGTGNFIGFVGDRSSAALVRRVIGTFRGTTKFPSEGGALFASLPGVGWSDQWSFWQAGYPGVMVTDTAPFRYPHYHSTADTPDKLDYDRMARVVGGLERVVRDLVGAP
jgi:Zn-dependent M28 family amino/carboxypeptidase